MTMTTSHEDSLLKHSYLLNSALIFTKLANTFWTSERLLELSDLHNTLKVDYEGRRQLPVEVKKCQDG